MSENLVPSPQALAVLRCREADVPALVNEAAARWVLRHVAFNSGFELRPTADGQWSRSRATAESPGFELSLDMRDCRFMLQSRPDQRRIRLQVLLGPGARHLRRNLPRLVDDFAAACMADIESIDLAVGKPLPVRGLPAAEPLVLPA
jgi:hypothetical protein